MKPRHDEEQEYWHNELGPSDITVIIRFEIGGDTIWYMRHESMI